MVKTRSLVQVLLENKRKFVGGVFFIALLLSVCIVYVVNMSRYTAERERVAYLAMDQAERTKYVLNNMMQKVQVLEWAVHKQDGRYDNFLDIAARLYDSTSVFAIELAPDCVVSLFYPENMDGNGSGGSFKGRDLLADPARSGDVLYSIEKRQLFVSPPAPLYQGGMGLIARQPIFIEDMQGKEKLWGLAIVVFKWPDIISMSGLMNLQQKNLSYVLSWVSPDTGDEICLQASETPLLSNPESYSFDLANTSCKLSITPKKGWIDLPLMGLDILIGLFASTLLAVLAWSLLSLQCKKEKFHQLSVTDTLTGLYNRRMLQKVLMERCSQNTQIPFLLCYMDLDGFKSVNDRFGHDVGDYLLQAATRRIELCMEPFELLFRMGGDEFVACMRFPGSEAAMQECFAKIDAALRHPFVFGAVEVCIGVSIGYVLYPRDGQEAETLLRIADAKMYAEKQRHKFR